jgi:hypothetical protein
MAKKKGQIPFTTTAAEVPPDPSDSRGGSWVVLVSGVLK